MKKQSYLKINGDAKLNPKVMLSFFCGDIDINLLQNEEQTADNDKEFFTREEIRGQLSKSLIHMISSLELSGINTNKPF